MNSKGDNAHLWADQIYQASTKCLMAHSIRAVEEFIEENLEDATRRRPHRIRVHIAPTGRYLGRRAIAFIHSEFSEIHVDGNISFQEQRLAIAHELAHILFAISKGDGTLIVRDAMTESACKIFEEHLCRLHDGFYADAENIKRLRFPKLWPNE